MAYCYHCMRPAQGEEPCPHCGHAPGGQTPEHALRPGTLLQERYLLGKVLGQGGFGITYIGRDQTLDLRIAIKEFFPFGYAARSASYTSCLTITDREQTDFVRTGMQRFLQEARVLARFSAEPGVVNVRDCFEENGTAYIVMEYLEGQDLRRALEERLFTADEIFAAMGPLWDALEKIHRQNVIHRDISPDNIMLLPDGSLKLMDFGAARSLCAGGDRSMSVTLKAGYAPPEQYLSHGEMGPWSDVYALCATIYKCITGKTPDNALLRSRKDELVWPSQMGIAIRPAQENVLKKGMEPDMEHRARSVAQLRALLQAGDDVTWYIPRSASYQPKDEPGPPQETPAQQENAEESVLQPSGGAQAPRNIDPVPPKAPAPPEPEKKPAAPKKRSLRVLVALAAGVLVIALCAAGVALFRWQQMKPVQSAAVSSGAQVHIRLQANEQMSVAQFNANLELLRARLDVLTGGAEYAMTIDGEMVYLELPEQAFAGHDVQAILRSYLSRPVQMYLFNGGQSNSWNPQRVQITSEDLESVKLCGGQVPGTDETPPYGYIECTLSDACLERIGETIASWESLAYGQDLDMDSYAWLPCIDAGDGKTFYLVDHDNGSQFILLLLHNMTHEPLSHAFYYTLESDIIWENPAAADVPGAYQVSQEALPEGCVTLYYSTYDDALTAGEWLDTVSAFKLRLDAIGQEYAFGSLRDAPYSVVISTPTQRMGMAIAQTLGGGRTLQLSCGLYYASLQSISGSYAIETGEDGPVLVFTPDGEEWDDENSFGRLAQYLLESEGELVLGADYLPLLGGATAQSLRSTGSVRFTMLACEDERPLESQDEWLLRYLVCLCEELSPPLSYSLDEYGVDSDAQFGLDYAAQKQSFTQAALSVWPQASVHFSDDESTAYVHLNLHVDETMGPQGAQLAREIYEATGFAESSLNQMVLYLTDDEDDTEKERARIFFTRNPQSAYWAEEPGYVCASGIFLNGRMERYKEDFRALIDADEFYQALADPNGFYTWRYEQ